MGFDKIHRKIVLKQGTPLYKLKVYSQTLTPALIAANVCAEQTFTVTGLATTDRVLAINNPSMSTPYGIVGMRVSAANTLALMFVNPTASTATPSAGTFKIIVIRE